MWVLQLRLRRRLPEDREIVREILMDIIFLHLNILRVRKNHPSADREVLPRFKMEKEETHKGGT